MEFQTLLEEAKFRYTNGYSQSRIVDYVYENANNETQANTCRMPRGGGGREPSLC